MAELRPPRQYSNGSVFVKYGPDGISKTAYYPSGRMAATYERMPGGFYAYFYADTRQATTLCTFDPSGYGFVSFEDGRPHLTSQRRGGSLVNESGSIEKSWTESKPLKGGAIEIQITPQMLFSFRSRRELAMKLTCMGLTEEFVLGDPPERADSYLSKSVGVVTMGPERGKQILDIDKCRQAAEAKQLLKASSASNTGMKKANINEDFMQKHEQLREVVRATDELQSSVKAGHWDVEVCLPKAMLAQTLGDQLPTLRMGDSLKGDPHNQSLKGMAAMEPDTLEVLLQSSGFDKGALPLSSVIKGASGRYRREHGEHVRTARRRLKEVKAKELDTFLNEEVPKGTLAVVCCLAGWLPQCRKVEPALELLNGELFEQAKAKAGEKGAPQSSFILCKFDMSESRLLRDRYNINTMPMYLMYYNGRLAYASNTLNGYGSSKDDLVAQARATLLSAQQGTFLPADFKFSLTDNRLTESFSATLSSTTQSLGTEQR
mmetsp:Transcript_13022/g.27726  ORF Transcript_13022/g.27726 Transcript_13022/m.27726 type:complete len:490 (-) Transcript_13022:334-1803(-)